jgi:hypothetical protein
MPEFYSVMDVSTGQLDNIYASTHALQGLSPRLNEDVDKAEAEGEERGDELEEGEICVREVYGYAYGIVLNGIGNVYGRVKYTRKLAIQSAALEAVKVLYRCGKLNEYLLPSELWKKSKKGMKPIFSLAKELAVLNSGNANTDVKSDVAPEMEMDGDFGTFEKPCATVWKRRPLEQKVYVTVVIVNGRLSDESGLESFQGSSSLSTWGLVTNGPLLVEEVPNFNVFSGKKANAVEMWSLGPEGCLRKTCAERQDVITLTEEESRLVKEFQSIFWKIAGATSDVNGELSYRVVPLAQTKKDVFEPMFWSVDWFVIQQMVCKKSSHVSLHNWIHGIVNFVSANEEGS